MHAVQGKGRRTLARGARWVAVLILYAGPATAWATDPPRDDLVINEILYDPVGPDEGHEFVELFNPTQRPLSLYGLVLEAGNGDREGDWRPQWNGAQSGVMLAAGGFYVIAGADAEVPADARVRLALQNGPDAVRLRRGQEELDRVGWGALLHEEFFEGAPAPDVPAGWVLARVADGVDTDSNHSDFVGRPWATAGASNTPVFGLQLMEVTVDPPLIDPGDRGWVWVAVRNIGRERIEPQEVDVALHAEGWRLDGTSIPGGALEHGEQGRWGLSVGAREGAWAGPLQVDVRVRDQAVGSGGCRVRVGRGPVLISEILYDPAADEGEWVEVANLSGEALSLAQWTLRDASGTQATVVAHWLAPGERAILAQNAGGFRCAWPDVDAGRIMAWSGRWPSLNNTLDRERGYADALLLSHSDGTPSDYIEYRPSPFDGDGVSLERWIDGDHLVSPRTLIPCPDAAGATPGDLSWAIEETLGQGQWLAPTPNPFYPDRPDGQRLCYLSIPIQASPGIRLTADVFDLTGRRRCSLTAGASVVQPTVLSWDGCDADRQPMPTGLYVWRIAVLEEGGLVTSRIQRPVTLVRE